MNGQTQTLEQIKQSIAYRALRIQSGDVSAFDGFDLFRKGNFIGAAIPTGDTYVNIHNVHPGRSYLLEGDNALPRKAGNFLTLTVDVTETDLADPVKMESFANALIAFTKDENGSRAALVADPWGWAERVIEMSGDKASDLRPYPYIAELYLVNKLRTAGLMAHPETEYRGPDAGTHDFELATMSLECKSHLHGDTETKKGELVISSEHQLSPTGTKPLYVVYFPMEDSGDLTLESCVKDFGSPRPVIMEKLAKSHFVEGDFAWQRPYHILGNPLVFEIDGNFPRITPEQFPGGRFPGGITKLVYHVSLQNLPSCPLDDFLAAIVAGKPPRFTV